MGGGILEEGGKGNKRERENRKTKAEKREIIREELKTEIEELVKNMGIIQEEFDLLDNTSKPRVNMLKMAKGFSLEYFKVIQFLFEFRYLWDNQDFLDLTGIF